MEICIIKLGAKGDVVRTTPILEAIKNKYPKCKITWITKESSIPILEGNPNISEIILMGSKIEKKFDLLFNLDIEKDATNLAQNISAKNKIGFNNEEGYPSAFNLGAEEYLNTLFDDELKKTNKKTYQELIFSAANLQYNQESIQLYINKEAKDYAHRFCIDNKINVENLIGIHMGSSPRWPSKAWHPECVKDFIKKASEQDYQLILFGGPDEKAVHKKIKNELLNEGIEILTNDPNNTDEEFISLVNLCSNMVCSDSYALHVSLGLKKPTIGLFFCTSPEEVEGYGMLTKLVSPKLYEFFPSKMDQFNEILVKSISADEVLGRIISNASS